MCMCRLFLLFDETRGARCPPSLKEHFRAEQHVTRAICFCTYILWCQLLVCSCHSALSALPSLNVCRFTRSYLPLSLWLLDTHTHTNTHTAQKLLTPQFSGRVCGNTEYCSNSQADVQNRVHILINVNFQQSV